MAFAADASSADKVKSLSPQENQRNPVDARIIAAAYAGIGDKEQALAWLEKAYAQHSNELTALKVDPGYDSLRDDPRFQDILQRVGLSN